MLHKLNHCGTQEAAIYRQGLGEFFLDDLWRLEAAWVVPAPEVQERLLALLQDERRALSLHQRPYNIVSYAWGRKYQQSNQWAIETLAAGHGARRSRRAQQAQAWLQFKGYQPTVLKIGPLTRLGGRAERGQRGLRRPPEREALLRPHRNRDGGFGVRLAAAHAIGGDADGAALSAVRASQ